MTTVGWHNVSPLTTPLGMFCHNIVLFIRVGEFVAITVGKNPPTSQLGRVIDISQHRNFNIPLTTPEAHYQGPFLEINHLNLLQNHRDAHTCIHQFAPHDEGGQVVIKNESFFSDKKKYTKPTSPVGTLVLKFRT
jgi:hypothetical protein